MKLYDSIQEFTNDRCKTWSDSMKKYHVHLTNGNNEYMTSTTFTFQLHIHNCGVNDLNDWLKRQVERLVSWELIHDNVYMQFRLDSIPHDFPPEVYYIKVHFNQHKINLGFYEII